MPEAAAAKKTPAKKAPKAKPAHPPTAAMVMAAVKALKEAKGSSLPAIKKYIAANYKVRPKQRPKQNCDLSAKI